MIVNMLLERKFGKKLAGYTFVFILQKTHS